MFEMKYKNSLRSFFSFINMQNENKKHSIALFHLTCNSLKRKIILIYPFAPLIVFKQNHAPQSTATARLAIRKYFHWPESPQKKVQI